MKFNRQKNKLNKKTSLVISAIIFLLVLALGLYTFIFADNFFGTKLDSSPTKQTTPFNSEPPTNEQKTTGESIKEQTVNNSGSEVNNNQSNISILVTSPTYQTESSTYKNLIIRTDIENIQTNTGVCNLRLTKGSTVITRQVEVQALSSYTTCKGFDIPMTELSSGTWSASITFESGSTTATVSQKIDIQRNQ